MNTALRNILFALFYVSLCYASENNPVASNRDILFALSDSVIDKIIIEHIKQYSSITLSTSNDTFTNFFRQRFITRLDSKHITVFDRSTSSGTTLELSVQESSVFFGELFTDSFLGSKKSGRLIRLTLNATCSSPTEGKILWSKQFSAIMNDTVSFSDIERMNNSTLPLTLYNQPELTFFDSILEPAIVIFSAGVAVYLFFTIRS